MQNKILLLIICVFVIYSCKKDDVVSISIKNSTLTITAPDSFSLAGPKIICNTALDVSADDYTYGFCYSLARNPVIPGLATGSQNYAAGSFSSRLQNLEYGKTYYIKAFVTNGVVVKYSNLDSFVMPQYMATGVAKNITARTFEVDITMGANIPDQIDSWGICYATKTKPIDTNFTRFSSTMAAGTITIQVADTLKPGTTYYLRSLIISNGRAFYGNEVSFTAAGYRGGSGGYIFFDKGDSTGGWRYLETVLDTATVTNSVWGCAGTLVPGVLPGIGTGLANSEAIVANCSGDNIAAKICRSKLLNTKTDWFLPSVDELTALYKLKLSKVINSTGQFLSSSQASASDCHVINFSTGLQEQLSKSAASALARPVRRF